MTLRSALALLAVLILAAPARAELSEDKKRRIAEAVAAFMKESRAPGVSVAVVEDGTLAWAQGWGYADLEGGVRASSTTLYRLGSLSKSLTGAGAARLWERGALDLDAPVRKYCPAFPEKEAPITTRQLLGHLGGVRHYKSDAQEDPETGNVRHFADPVAGGLSFFASDPLVEKPGTKFRYTTQGFTVVGCAMEGASGRKFVDLMREEVLVPAGMTTAREDDRFAIVPGRTRFYSKDSSGTVRNADFLDSSYKIPGGGFIGSVLDMARFEEALLSGALMKTATRDAAWTSQRTSAGEETGYGWGFGVYRQGGRLVVGHSGGQQGTSTDFRIAPAERTGTVVMANMNDVDAKALDLKLLEVVLGPAPSFR